MKIIEYYTKLLKLLKSFLGKGLVQKFILPPWNCAKTMTREVVGRGKNMDVNCGRKAKIIERKPDQPKDITISEERPELLKENKQELLENTSTLGGKTKVPGLQKST